MKITLKELKDLIKESLDSDNNAVGSESDIVKITSEQLNQIVKEVIQDGIIEELVKKSNLPWTKGSKYERQVHDIKASLRKEHPDWTQDKIKSIAIATTRKNWNKEH